MTAIPDSGILGGTPTEGEYQIAIEDFRDAATEMPGGAAATTLEISGDQITPTGAFHIVDVEGLAAASDDLTNAALTNHPAGRIVTYMLANNGRNVVFKNASGGDGQFLMCDSADFTLDETNQSITFIRVANNWVEIDRSYGNVKSAFRTYLGLGTAALVDTGTSGANVPTITQADARYAALAGLNSQTFSVAAASASDHAVRKSQLDAAVSAAAITQGRLTLATGVPFTTTDQTAKTTLYFTPLDGNRIGLYNGSSWDIITFAEISIAVPATTNQMYDVFVYNNSGTATLELTAWTDDSNRATALTLQDGVLVKTGALTRKFVGCMRTTGSSGQTEVSAARKLVANYYNRKPSFLKATDGTNTWTSTTATFHDANGNTTPGTGRVDFITCVGDQLVEAESLAMGRTDQTTFGQLHHSGIGLDASGASAVTPSSQLSGAGLSVSSGTIGSSMGSAWSRYKGYPAAGYHFLQNLVAATVTGTTTFYGDDGTTLRQSGLLAMIAA